MSIYAVIRLVGTSPTSWEAAAKGALEEAISIWRISGLPKSSNSISECRTIRSSSIVPAFEYPSAIIPKSIARSYGVEDSLAATR